MKPLSSGFVSNTRIRQRCRPDGRFVSGYLSVLLFRVESAIAAKIPALAQTATWFQNLLKGEGGMIASLLAVLVGIIYVALKKDWSALLGAVLLALGTAMIVDMISASFTACV